MVELLSSATSLRWVARLASGVTSTSGAFPHGGADMGYALACEWMPGQQVIPMPGEDLGGEPVDHIITHEAGILAVVFAGMPNEVVTRIMAHSSTGASGAKTGGYGMSGDDSRLASAREFTLLVSPRSSVHPALLIYRACPSWDETARLQGGIDQDLGMACVFRGIRHATKGVHDWGRPGDISP